MINLRLGEKEEIRLPSNAKRCVMHLVHLRDSFLTAKYLHSAWMQDKYDRHNLYFVIVSDLGMLGNDTSLMDLERLYFLMDRGNVRPFYRHSQ